jgi:hypothetical protein
MFTHYTLDRANSVLPEVRKFNETLLQKTKVINIQEKLQMLSIPNRVSKVF